MHLARASLGIAPHRLRSALCAAEPGPTDGTSSPASAPLAAKTAATNIHACVLDNSFSFLLMSYRVATGADRYVRSRTPRPVRCRSPATDWRAHSDQWHHSLGARPELVPRLPPPHPLVRAVTTLPPARGQRQPLPLYARPSRAT